MLPLLLVGLTLALAASAPMPFTTVARGGMSQIDSARTVVVRTAPEWTELWKAHAGSTNPPAVDFTRTMVLAVFAGMRPSGGYAVEITQIEKNDGAMVVTYRERKPGPDDITTQALTFPFHIVRTDAHGGEVTFRAAR